MGLDLSSAMPILDTLPGMDRSIEISMNIGCEVFAEFISSAGIARAIFANQENQEARNVLC